MRPHGPWLISVRRRPDRNRVHLPGSYKLVWRDFNRDISYFAPRLVAWLYRIIPMHLGFAIGVIEPSLPQEITRYRWYVQAPVYHFAWLPGTGLKTWWPGKGY